MKFDESKITDIECDHIRTLETKKITYRGLEIYAVKRSIYTSDTERAFLHKSGINTAWWCGYVEVVQDMQDSFGGRRCFEDNVIKLSCGNKTKEYILAHVQEGYTYAAYGIPLVLVNDYRLFLGWDYNHWPDTEDCVTYQEILKEGMKVIDSMLAPKSTG